MMLFKPPAQVWTEGAFVAADPGVAIGSQLGSALLARGSHRQRHAVEYGVQAEVTQIGPWRRERDSNPRRLAP